MIRYLIIIFIIPISLFAQSKPELTKHYSQAIGDYIKAVKKEQKVNFDTLFFGNHDQLPDIEWPNEIEKTFIRVIAIGPESKFKKHFVNMAGTVSKEKAEFIFFTFSQNFKHQFDYFINYKYNSATKTFELDKISFKGPPFK